MDTKKPDGQIAEKLLARNQHIKWKIEYFQAKIRKLEAERELNAKRAEEKLKLERRSKKYKLE